VIQVKTGAGNLRPGKQDHPARNPFVLVVGKLNGPPCGITFYESALLATSCMAYL